MLTVQLQRQILQLKSTRQIAILAHHYQSISLLEIADCVGDFKTLAAFVATTTIKTLLFCGIRQMGLSLKCLFPDRHILLIQDAVDCPNCQFLQPLLPTCDCGCHCPVAQESISSFATAPPYPFDHILLLNEMTETPFDGTVEYVSALHLYRVCQQLQGCIAVGAEHSQVTMLQMQLPEKRIIHLFPDWYCTPFKETTLMHIYQTLKHR